MIFPPPAAMRSTPPGLARSDDFADQENAWIAGELRQAAVVLAAQGAHPARGDAYRCAADAIATLGSEVRVVAETGGYAALAAMPGIGDTLAGAVAELVTTGRWGFLERLNGASDAEAMFCAIPGIGPSLAHKIQETLRIDSLETLEGAARDGRLQRMASFGPRRAAMVLAALAAGPTRVTPPAPRMSDEPDVAVLLNVDREYREEAASGELPMIVPRRFDRDIKGWLPVLHTVRGPWHFTALWSNTLPEHRRGRTGDWVAMYFHCEGKPEGRRTIMNGPRRVVRGREAECEVLDMPMAVAPAA